MSTAVDPIRRDRLQRAFRVLSAVLLLGAVIGWLTPVNVPGANLQPYDCGTPAAASPGYLSRLVCSETMRQSRGIVLALAIAAVLAGVAYVEAAGRAGQHGRIDDPDETTGHATDAGNHDADSDRGHPPSR